jgi:hypothetical protein
LAVGLRRCGSGGYQACGNYDADSCLEWGAIVSCGTGKICSNGICVAGDTAPPVISVLGPSGIVYSSAATLTVVTNEAAECSYSLSDISFDSMKFKLVSTDKFHHSVSLSLPKYGAYAYYVKCRDAAGNANLIAGKVSFNYSGLSSVKKYEPDPILKKDPVSIADTLPPVISDLLPTGSATTTPVEISLKTNEKATCKYDIVDTDYDSMENTMDGDNEGKFQSKKIALSASAVYNYYVKCKDVAGNINKTSSIIGFDYAPENEQGPSITGFAPFSTVYQNEVALSVNTDESATCRYSEQDQDFDLMAGSLFTADGLQQIATVVLDGYGNHPYYVRCRGENGSVEGSFATIEFEYKNPNESLVDTPIEPLICSQTVLGDNDNVCDPVLDCVCDPDCPAEGGNADSDCAKMEIDANGGEAEFSSGNIWIIVVPQILVVIAIVEM